ncbi:hypothetical protein RJ639_032984 [Escallonia herrerae]|uniref:Glutaredoxin domain-containing protein n=1 Tax=Escallonia herrerae TaxID=1293975 RepID=A0AA88WX47_9ASTE|nr:hypothetical protein RJ639_032984 [Escallonia herrerae]
MLDHQTLVHVGGQQGIHKQNLQKTLNVVQYQKNGNQMEAGTYMRPYDPSQRPKLNLGQHKPFLSAFASRVLILEAEKMHYQAMEESWGQYYYVPALEQVVKLASKSAVVIFSLSSCCMCHAVKRLFCGMGVNPTVYELDQDPIRGKAIERALTRLLGGGGGINGGLPAVPVVFIGGKLVGAMDRVMASHINGTLVPLLKEAGALWL